MIRITDERKSKKVLVGILDSGDRFEYENKFYMRVTSDSAKNETRVCELATGRIVWGVSDWMVTPVDVEVRIVG